MAAVEGRHYMYRMSQSRWRVGDIVVYGIEVGRVLKLLGMGCLPPFVAA